jgi:tetratricopeptide (TPR) repeat protein
MHISGLLTRVKNDLNNQLKKEFKRPIGLLKAIGFVNLFTKNFNEAFYYYNQLIDVYKQRDSKTLFFAAVSAIGANLTQNAIALLSISKTIDGNNFESRYALGLLYQEIGNLKGAIVQYNKIGDVKFNSKYFDFNIIKGK